MGESMGHATRVGLMAAMAAAVTLAACGGGGGTNGPSPGPVVSVGGDYAMAVVLAENSCGAVTVLPLPTRVAHTPGATQFQLTHGPNTFEGTLEGGGAFRTAPRTFADAGSSVTLSIAGRFLLLGLDATVTVDQSAPAPACRYLVRWMGTKQGAANVIP
jgi:hypothetical protein